VQLAQRSRLLIPEGFREFLGVEPNARCGRRCGGVHRDLEPSSWLKYLQRRMPKFRRLFDGLSS